MLLAHHFHPVDQTPCTRSESAYAGGLVLCLSTLALHQRTATCAAWPFMSATTPAAATGTAAPAACSVAQGQKTILITALGDALLVWRKFIDDSGQRGVNCAVFRNEGPALSSGLIREAMAVAWGRWPGERLYTYVDPRRVGRTNPGHNPGYCFLKAGWRRCGRTRSRGLLILERLPAA